ncbi:GGDEF domain-containing protein [Quadrisphaera sp. INWT6]|uniref:GGDEF domain-containing protein n=1 Tax=Quadrisphaera sp. INWT6 TaxID=2596917 RepID=UPI0018922777|nr:GGDEF domain-containing protein [Quadrisphaera sp. INWT6]MBF5081485.1 GGDEF domain-containing protein [Quadrisphaera sp. INWT6]
MAASARTRSATACTWSVPAGSQRAEPVPDPGADGRVALPALTLDRHDEVRTVLGHHAGDELIVEVARRLTGHRRARHPAPAAAAPLRVTPFAAADAPSPGSTGRQLRGRGVSCTG